MGSSEPCESVISEDVGHNLSFYSNICGESDDFSAQEIGVTLSQVLHVHDENELIQLVSSSDDTCDEMEMLSLSFKLNLSEGLNNSEAVAYHEVGQSHPQNLNATEKIISAIKGSRAQQGILLNSKLSVKWARDVYDPPVTSESHTVKGHRHKSIKKDYYKHKHIKAKNSHNSSDRKHIHRSNSNNRKHVHRSSSQSSSSSAIDPQMLRLQGERSLVSNFFLSKVEDVLDRPVGVQELKCRGSFCVSVCHLQRFPE